MIVNPNEKNESIVYNIKTYEWSNFPNEDEILFLPYSTFSIKNIKYERFKIKCRDKENKISYLNVMGKIIQLEYIGKYIEKINIVDYSDEDILKLIERIKQSKFYNEILNSKLIENQSDDVIKDFIDEYFRKKKEMNSNTNFDNQNENKFNFPQVPVEKRFENFINNKNNNHPYINNIQYNNNYNINNNNNNNLNLIMENNVY